MNQFFMKRSESASYGAVTGHDHHHSSHTLLCVMEFLVNEFYLHRMRRGAS